MTGKRELPSLGRGPSMPADTPVPCAGEWRIFDSMDLYDHIEAKALCDTCPVLRECATLLADVKREGGILGQPEGTWAGKLHEPPNLTTRQRANQRRNAEREAAEEAAFDDDAARIAHSQYQNGNRTEWTRTGHKVYQRRNKRKQRAEGAA